ncbi:MAG: (Fe-S)-binding protein [Nitrospirae bacterium]|nr:(Fe-S)-binding protein [Nitrospirota bacterium]
MNDTEFIHNINLCVKCGGCKAECPTYFASSKEMESARGRMRLLKAFLSGELAPGKKLSEKIFSCLLCGDCSNRCPLNIDIQEVIYHARYLLKSYDKKRRFYRPLTKMLFKNTDFSVKLYKPFQKYFNKRMVADGLIPEDVEFCENQFKKTNIFLTKDKIGRVAVFSGCTAKHVYPELSYSLANVLNALNYEVVFPNTEVCCGAPFRSLGLNDTAIKYAEKNYNTFSKLNVDAIVSLCPTCVVALKKHYKLLIGKEFDNVYDISTFLREKLTDRITTKSGIDLDVSVHDSCHDRNELKTGEITRAILTGMGAKIIEPHKQTCCGFGGTFSLFYKDMSNVILKDTLKGLVQTGAKAFVTTCPNCIFQLSKLMKDKPIYHLIELVEEVLMKEQKKD